MLLLHPNTSQSVPNSSLRPAFAAPLSLPLRTPLYNPPATCSRNPSTFAMADISKPRPGIGKRGPEFGSDRGGGVAVITKPDTKKKTKRKSQTEFEKSWRVLLHNDDVHTFEYVTGAIVKVCFLLISTPFSTLRNHRSNPAANVYCFHLAKSPLALWSSNLQVVRTVSRKKAHRITMTAHTAGVATVTTTWKAQAEAYCKGLQREGLTSSIAPDSSFTK